MGRKHAALDDVDDLAGRIRSQIADGKEPRAFDLYQQLALIVHQHRAFNPDEKNVAVPLELLSAIAIKLIGKRRWAKEEQARRMQAVDVEHKRILAEADALRARSPNMSASSAAAHLLKGASPPLKRIRGESFKLSHRAVRDIISTHWKTN